MDASLLDRPLWEHQKKFIARCDRQPHVACFFEPGLGKTRAMIEVLRREYARNGKVGRTLVICPVSTTKQWKGAFAAYSKIPAHEIEVLTQPGKKRADKLREGLFSIAITNFEGMRIPAFYDALLKWCPEFLIIDESHRIKDSRAVTSKKIYPLAIGSRRRFLLSGTPILKSMLDIFGQFKALDPRIFGGSKVVFQRQYFYDKNASMPPHLHWPDWVPKPGAAAELKKIIANNSVEAQKHDCLDLPPRIDIEVPVEMSRQQASLYNSMVDEFVAQLKGVECTAEFAMTQSLRLQQIIAGYVAPKSTEPAAWCDNLPRMEALRELLESLGKAQVIIWTNFAPTYPKIGKLCEDLKLSYTLLTGQQSTKEKETSIEQFKRGEAQVLISNPAAGGVGVDGLQVAPYAIYYLRSYNLEHFLQSRDRNYRGGSEMHSSIIHYHLMTENTLDRVIFDALMAKKKIGDVLLGWASPWTRRRSN